MIKKMVFSKYTQHVQNEQQITYSLNWNIRIRISLFVVHDEWRSKDELVSDVLVWCTCVGWHSNTYIQQLFADTVCSLEDPSKTTDHRDGTDGEREYQENLCNLYDSMVMI